MSTAYGCKGSGNKNQENTDSATEQTSEADEDKADLATENKKVVYPAAPNNGEKKTEEPKEQQYVHGEDGYFSLIDEGYGTPVKSQVSGTCWATAAAASMESAFKIKNDEDITIEPVDIVDLVYGNDKEEGYFLKEKTDPLDIGGWAWQVVETLSNGFGEYYLEDATDYGEADMDAMKAAIKKDGAMNVAINDMKTDLFGGFDGYRTLNDPDSESYDHEVTLVGWDDHFPKEYFKKEATQDGAWLAQNTRGSNWGKKGYYWVSYDTPFREQTIFKLAKDYKKIVSYDGGKENVIQTENTTILANKFHESGTLMGIGTYTVAPNQSIKIQVYDENFDSVLFTMDATFETQGYHTVMFEEGIEVKDYAVAITYNGAAPVEGETWDDEFLSYSVGIHKGESFVYVDGKWVDMSDEEIQKILKIDFQPNNACIKAIY